MLIRERWEGYVCTGKWEGCMCIEGRSRRLTVRLWLQAKHTSLLIMIMLGLNGTAL